MAMTLCEICGNEFDPKGGQCPFCHTERTSCTVGNGGPQHRVVNLEKGKPLVQQALDRLAVVVSNGRREGYKALTLIHGYGSSGKGGAIKEAVRQHLQFLHQQGTVRTIIPGEEFEGRSGRGRQLLRCFPFLAEHRDLNRANPGITLIIL
jgi:hypothetical protein